MNLKLLQSLSPAMRILAAIMLILAFSFKTESQLASLKIEVSNIEKNEGEILVALFRIEDRKAFPEDIDNLFQYKIVMANTPSVQLVFDKLKPGTYAYSIVQDFNGNKYTDKNFVGYPTEPYGFSLNFKPLFSAPDFEDCQFELKEGVTEHEVRLIH